MGGQGDLLLPVGERRMSSWAAHQKRKPRSSEPGTDFYCPIGTPVFCPADGVIYGAGNTIGPATGRWVGVQFDNGMSFRTLHLSKIERFSGSVKRGDLLGYSGASGYGDEDWSWNPNTGGAHTHVTLWPSSSRRFGYDAFGKPYTIDFMNFVGGPRASGNSESKIETKEYDEMQMIGNNNDGYKFMDELGADDWIQYSYVVPGQATFMDNLVAAGLLAGAPVPAGGWPLQVARHMANTRWDQKRGQIVSDTVSALRPLFEEISKSVAGISPEKFADLIEKGLEAVVIKAEPISEEDRVALATAVREKFREDPPR